MPRHFKTLLIAQLVAALLKLFVYQGVSWWLVLAPILCPVVLMFLVVAFLILFAVGALGFCFSWDGVKLIFKV